MITEEQIQAVVRRIIEGYAPDRIILFGSYAYGEPTEDSDLDLLVIKANDQQPKRERLRSIKKHLHDEPWVIDIDVAVLNEPELQEAEHNRFCREYVALRQGRNVYGAGTRIKSISENAPLSIKEKASLRRWLKGAEQDLEAARALALQAYYDGFARTCQLSAEKVLKACLMSLKAVPPPGHDLRLFLAAIARQQLVEAETWRKAEMIASYAALFHDCFFKVKNAPSKMELLQATAHIHHTFAPSIRQCLA
ncbi:MAG: HEPN domain-containing protein [Hymenobacter sp.]|nr:MAG: HEPN domain-containing protein [Hymenobacter sp.]